MRPTVLATAATLAVLTAATFAPANAMSLSAPAGVQAAIEDLSLTQDAAFVCRREWGLPLAGAGPAFGRADGRFGVIGGASTAGRWISKNW
jgi:hypothetical protein